MEDGGEGSSDASSQRLLGPQGLRASLRPPWEVTRRLSSGASQTWGAADPTAVLLA
jgi:hypothetical protein